MRRRLLIAALAATALIAPQLGHAQEGGGAKQKPSYLSLKTVTVSIVRPDGRR